MSHPTPPLLLTGPTGPMWSEDKFAMLVMNRGVVIGGVSGFAFHQDPQGWLRRCWRLLFSGRWV